MSLLSEAEELAIGQQQDAEIRREMGVYDDPELQRYVSDIGQELARDSHRPNLPWTFTVVDSPAINAFALPGGYIYLTRGILAYLDDESELAGVLGHEIGHVTARHAAQAYTRQAQANLGLTVLSIFVPSTRRLPNSARPAWACCSSSTGAKRSSKPIGSASSTDPAPATIRRRAAVSRHARARRCVERARRAELVVDASRSGTRASPRRSRSRASSCRPTRRRSIAISISSASTGLVFGDNPKDGIVRGNEFLHPLLRIGVKFPDGWELTNTPEAVMAQEPGTEHFMVLQEVEQARFARAPAGRRAVDRRHGGGGDAQGRLHRRRRHASDGSTATRRTSGCIAATRRAPAR